MQKRKAWMAPLAISWALLFVVTACAAGVGEAQVSVEESPAESQNTERASDDKSRLVERMSAEPLVDASGSLLGDIDEVVAASYSYDSDYESVSELLEHSELVVLAVTAGRNQYWEGDGAEKWEQQLVTQQWFETTRIIVGDDVPDRLSVLIPGGVFSAEDDFILDSEHVDILLEESQEEPQFRDNSEYLLFLEPAPVNGDAYWTVGPGEGRYSVKNDVVSGWYVDDLHSDEYGEEVTVYPTVDRPEMGRAAALAAEIVGSTMDDIEREIDLVIGQD